MRGPPMLRLKLLEIYIAELNVLFSLICWSSVESLNVYTYIYLLFCFDVKDVHCSAFSKNFHLHKIYYISSNGATTLAQNCFAHRGALLWNNCQQK